MNPTYPQGGPVPVPNPSYPMARLHSSAYAAPLNYNQPSEVVGGYDAKINPMTGEEVPQTNFAGGGGVPHTAGLASFVQSKGRGDDTMLVHMTPGEVQGLQSLALAHGGSLTINPQTGLPEAGFLSKLLPTLLGFGLSFIPGVGPLMAAGLVGAGETIRTGDLGKGLMAGLGAYGGAGIGSAVSGVGSVAKAAAGTPGISQMTPQAFQESLSKEAVSAAAKQGASKAGFSAGVEAIKTAPLTSLKAVGTQLGSAGVGSLGSTALNVMTPEMKVPKGSKEDNLYYISGGYSDEEGFAPGQYTRTYPGLPPPGMAEGGDVEKAKQQALEAFAMAPQQAAPSSAGLQQYMSNLNRFLAGADKAAPTYIAPPPKPVTAPPPPTTPAAPPTVSPPTYGPIDFGNLNLNALREYGFDPEQVRQGLRNFGYKGDFAQTQPAANKYQPSAFDAYNPYTGEFDQSKVDAAMQPPVAPPAPPIMTTPPAPSPYSVPDMGRNIYAYEDTGTAMQPEMAPAYEPPVYQQPAYQEPVYQEPSYQEPQYQAPIYQAAEERTYIPRVLEEAPVQEFLGTPYMPQPEMAPISPPPIAQMPEERSYIPREYQEYIPEEPLYIPRKYQEYIPEVVEQYTPPAMMRPSPEYPVFEQYAARMPDYGLAAIAPQMAEERRFAEIESIPSGAMGEGFNFGFAGGGSVPTMQYAAAGKLLRGPGDGMSDDIKANIGGTQEARLADGEFVIPADVVSHLGNGSSEAGSKQLYAMMDRIRMARTGRKRQAPEVDAEKFLPA